jgi:hypothetical protein
MRPFSVFVLVTAMFTAACGGDDDPTLPNISTLFPANNEIGSWVEDTTTGTAGVEIATDETGIVALINGGAEPFLARNYNAFGIEYYTDGTYDLELRIWQFATAAISTEMYTALLTESSTHQSSNWDDNTLGAAGRVANTNTTWWFNTRDGAHLLEVTIGESGAAPDAASKTAGETFVNGVLGKL